MGTDLTNCDWASYYSFAEDFHPTFKAELSKQLLEKASGKPGLEHLEKYNFQLLVGLEDISKRIIDNRMYALIEPLNSSEKFSPVGVFWTIFIYLL